MTWEQQTIKGDVATTIAAAAESLAADLIVMGTHGRTGLTHALLGSVAEGVARAADTCVLTVRTGSMHVRAAVERSVVVAWSSWS